MASRTGLWRVVVAGTVVLLALIAGPAPAFARFTDTAHAATPYSTGTIGTPAAAQTNAVISCTKTYYFFTTAVITVKSYGKVNRATAYSIKITDPAGTIRDTGELSPDADYTYQRTYLAGDNKPWTYEIRASYTAPGTTNTWTAKDALTGTLTCT